MANSRFLDDTLRQPQELRAILGRLAGPLTATCAEAAALLRAAPMPLLAGMGSSFHGGFAIQAFFDAAARPVRNVDAGELVHFVGLARGATLLVLSRSGRSIEIVELLAKAQAAGARVIGVTNDPESPLARGASPAILLGAPFDHNVSVTMYSGVALAGAWLAAHATGAARPDLVAELDAALADAEARLAGWRAALAASAWCVAEAPTILLARGPGLAAAHEARQLWEEAAKHPATALSTGAFRHGPQEVVRAGARIVLWLPPPGPLRELDLALAQDLREAGAAVALVGTALTGCAAELLLELPPIPPAWQFLVDLMPVQLLAERLAAVRGVDCDVFRWCPFVVDGARGLGTGHGGAAT